MLLIDITIISYYVARFMYMNLLIDLYINVTKFDCPFKLAALWPLFAWFLKITFYADMYVCFFLRGCMCVLLEATSNYIVVCFELYMIG